MSSTYATTSLEIEIGITATYDSPDRSVGYYGGYMDHEVENLAVLIRNPDPEKRKGASYYIPKSVMKGVDVRSKDIQQLFANILEHCDLEAWASEANAEACDAEDYERERRIDSGLMAGQAGRGL